MGWREWLTTLWISLIAVAAILEGVDWFSWMLGAPPPPTTIAALQEPWEFDAVESKEMIVRDTVRAFEEYRAQHGGEQGLLKPPK